MPAQLGMHWQRLELLQMFCERSLQLYGLAVSREKTSKSNLWV